MDVGIVFGLSGILIAIFIATIMFVWQANSVSNRFDAGFQAQGAEIKALGERVDAKIEAQGAEIKALGEKLEAEIKAQGQRVSDSELEQARLNGVNSVVTRQAHTHESLAD